jgi:hypothetical protein
MGMPCEEDVEGVGSVEVLGGEMRDLHFLGCDVRLRLVLLLEPPPNGLPMLVAARAESHHNFPSLGRWRCQIGCGKAFFFKTVFPIQPPNKTRSH